MLIQNARTIFIYVMKYVSVSFQNLYEVDRWNNLLLSVPNRYEVVAMVQQVLAVVASLWYHTLR